MARELYAQPETLFAISFQTVDQQSSQESCVMERRPTSLFDPSGRRKYVTLTEREAFLLTARLAAPNTRTFCETLAYTGCRISEALALTSHHIDPANGVLIFETLKKRRRGVYRAVPVPGCLIRLLIQTFPKISDPHTRVWPWSRSTGWRRICEVMQAAGIEGPHASPKGLRHGFGVHAVASSIPLNMLQKWLGHSQISTTAIYADAMGPEERRIAERMWGADAA